jgi:hypothetical protein
MPNNILRNFIFLFKYIILFVKMLLTFSALQKPLAHAKAQSTQSADHFAPGHGTYDELSGLA